MKNDTIFAVNANKNKSFYSHIKFYITSKISFNLLVVQIYKRDLFNVVR